MARLSRRPDSKLLRSNPPSVWPPWCILKALMFKTRKSLSGFTIVELLIIIVVIGILAGIVTVAYNGMTASAVETSMKSDLQNAATHLESERRQNNGYPANGDGLENSEGNTFSYETRAYGYCLTVTNAKINKIFYVDSKNVQKIEEGECPADTPYMQTVTTANCPTTRTMAIDARDNHTYWVQKFSDGRCWMLTNLGYAGGGTDTYGDAKPLTNGTGGAVDYNVAYYYVVPDTTNYTTNPTAPSTSTDGTGQYGYLYNWCAAMGAQPGGACSNGTAPVPNAAISICPAGWRLPTSNGGELTALNTAVNNGLTNTDSGLRANWLAQRSGTWYNGFSNQGVAGFYRSSNQYSVATTYVLSLGNTNANPVNTNNKVSGFAVRCIAV